MIVMERVCLLMSMMKQIAMWGIVCCMRGSLAVDDGAETAETQRPYDCQEAGADCPATSPGPAVGEGLNVPQYTRVAFVGSRR